MVKSCRKQLVCGSERDSILLNQEYHEKIDTLKWMIIVPKFIIFLVQITI